MQYFSLLYSFSISCYNIDMKKLLLELAHEAINHKLTGAPLVDKEQIITQYPKLNDQRATFVTLNLDGRLRGCIGSLIAHRTLYDDIIHNAQSAAFGDPRFAPLSLEEFQYVDIEISLLTPAELLPYDDITDLRSKIIANKHGVILKLGSYQATFLPQVWEQLPTFETFFAHLCAKAGLSGSCLEQHPQIYTYEVEKIK